jgi:hypothetical protein
MGDSKNSRRGVRRSREDEPHRGKARSALVKVRNHKRTRALRRGVMSHNAADFEEELMLVPAKNVNAAVRGCLACGYIARG